MPSADSTRSVALRVLTRVETGAWSNRALAGELGRTRLDARDRGLVTELVRGTLRWQSALDALVEQFTDRPLAGLDVEVRQALRLGAYQLTMAAVPPHAAVSTAVGALDGHPGGRLVNGVLRALSRSGPPWPWPPPGDPVPLAFPGWLRDRWAAAPDLLAALQRPATTHLALRPDAERDLPGGARPGVVPGTVRLEEGGDPASLVRAGVAVVLDESSAGVAWTARQVAGGSPVLDLCAGPGGKAAVMAMGGPVVAADLRAGRVRAVGQAAERLGLHVPLVVADAARPPFGAVPAGAVVLIDAPCTGLGTLRRRPEIRHRVQPDDPAALAQLQVSLVRAGLGLLPPGGSLIYSVCTLTEEETVGVARAIAGDEAEEAGVGLPLAPHPVAGPGPGGFFLPHVHDTDGMYLLHLIRR